ncbi:MAG: murein hydrolase activator EnvC family protein [Rhodospirillales bacterium]
MRSPDARGLALYGALYGALAVALAASGAPPASAQEADEQRLDQTRKEKERQAQETIGRAAEQQRLAEEAAKREQALRQDRRDAVAREHRRAEEARRVEAEIARLGEDERAKRAALSRHDADRQHVLVALLRLAGNAPAFLVALPGPPLENLQTALAFRAMERELARSLSLLTAALADLGRVRDAAEQARLRAAAERAALAEETRRIERMLIESADEQRRAAGERAKLIDEAEKLRAEARDDEELIAALVQRRQAREEAGRRAREEEAKAATRREAAQPPPPVPPVHGQERPNDLRPGPPARGGMTNPVSGRVVRNYGQTDASGSASRGVVFGAEARARVVAPYDGQVVYAGPFRGYGRILIIEHGGGYHTLLSGLGRIDCAVGQWLLAGEPVAVMGEQSGAGLYVELRRDGQPVNPLPWLAAGNG